MKNTHPLRRKGKFPALRCGDIHDLRLPRHLPHRILLLILLFLVGNVGDGSVLLPARALLIRGCIFNFLYTFHLLKLFLLVVLDPDLQDDPTHHVIDRTVVEVFGLLHPAKKVREGLLDDEAPAGTDGVRGVAPGAALPGEQEPGGSRGEALVDVKAITMAGRTTRLNVIKQLKNVVSSMLGNWVKEPLGENFAVVLKFSAQWLILASTSVSAGI